MLKLKYLFENYELAKEALSNWEHDPDTLDQMLSQFRISSNAIYPFCQDGKTCFLRLSPFDEKLEKNIFGEIEFIEYLLASGYPALTPIKSKTGEICMILNTQWGKYYASAFHKVSGIPVEDTDLSDEVMFVYGKSLGKLHSLSSAFIPRTKKWSHTDALNWITSVFAEYNAPEYAIAELSALKNALCQLPVHHDTYGLVHYDFEPDNVFYNKESNSCTVIDFEDGMYHWYALDIEQVFDSLEEELEGEALQRAENEFIKGYTKEHCYTQEMILSRPILKRFINLYGYARLIRCVAEKFADEPEWLVELRLKLEKAIAEKETFMLKV